MSYSRKFIDRLVEDQEQATVKVELSGTPSAVQKALRQLGKSKSGIKKAVGGDVDVKISDPKVVKSDDKGDKSKDKGDKSKDKEPKDKEPKDKEPKDKEKDEKIPRFEKDGE